MQDIREVYEMTAIELAQKLFQADKEKVFVVAQIAPAVRVMIGEKFGLARGEDAMKKLCFALRAMGADAVTDTAIAQDVITLAQVKALLFKKEQGGAPVIAGKGAEGPCAGEMSARLLRKYYAEREGAKSVRIVAVVCCEKGKNKVKGADVVLTVDELSEMILATGENLRLMGKSSMDTPLGVASGAAYICAAAGGKAEAVARCLMENKTREAVQKLAYSGLYAKGGIKEAALVANGQEWKFAVVVCPEEAEKVRTDIENGVCEYDFVEFSCGGCITKGIGNAADKERTLKLRKAGLAALDRAHAASSADMSSYAALAAKEWEKIVRRGEACQELSPITEEELMPAQEEEDVIELAIEGLTMEMLEKVIAEGGAKQIPLAFLTSEEEIFETVAKEELPEEVAVEETAEELPEEVAIEETAEELPEEVAVEETAEELPEEVAVEETVEELPEEVAVEETAEDTTEIVAEDIDDKDIEEIVEQLPIEEIAQVIIKKYGENPTDEEIQEIIEELFEEDVEEAVEDYVEDVVADTVDETFEGVIEEVAEEASEVVEEEKETPETEEQTAEVVEEVFEEEVIEETAEGVAEIIAEEQTEEAVEAIVESAEEEFTEMVEEVEDAPAEELPEIEEKEACAETAKNNGVQPYHKKLSNAERRKLKRKNKNNK